MTEAPAAPYPPDTRAKGWRFELDLERVQQSDTWALAAPEERPWLLMLWTTAWQQTPCGSLPADDRIIAARIGMPAKAWSKSREVLLRGWVLHADGRLYHATITERVVDMLARKNAERDRKAAYRARMSAVLPQPPASVPGTSASVPVVSHGTTAGLPRESGGSDATGTGTGTGTKVGELHPGGGDSPREDRAKEPGNPEPPEPPPPPEPTAAALVTLALRRAGIGNANPGHPRLLALLEAGATGSEFLALAPRCQGRDDPFSYLLAVVEGERKRAADIAAAPRPPTGFAPFAAASGLRPNAQIALEERNRAVAAEWLRAHGAADAAQ